MQGYMSQGYTAEQAKMLTDEYFRPQWINAEADRWVGRSKWCWAGVVVFVLLASQFLSVSSQDGNGVGGVVWMLILAAGLGFYAKHCSLKALAIRQQLDSPQPTVHQPHDPVIVDIQPTGVTRPSWDPRDRRAIPPPPMFPPRTPPTPPPF
jgi:hypothetical protein